MVRLRRSGQHASIEMIRALQAIDDDDDIVFK